MNYQYNTQQTGAPQQFAQAQRPATYSPSSWNPRVRPVSSIEEVRASSIDFDGSVFYFPDVANKKIYTKFINMDGTVGVNVYELKETPIGTPADSSYVTREEFENTISQIKMMYESFSSKPQEENNPQNVNQFTMNTGTQSQIPNNANMALQF